MGDYQALMERRVTWSDSLGFEPIEIHSWLFEHQKRLVDYSLRKGRSAIFADTGLGKTAMELSWAENVYRHTGRPHGGRPASRYIPGRHTRRSTWWARAWVPALAGPARRRASRPGPRRLRPMLGPARPRGPRGQRRAT